MDSQTTVQADLKALLDLLMSEDRSDRLKSEQQRLKEYIKEVERLIRLEKSLQGQTEAGMQEKFGAVLEAFDFGAPPHGGIALGIDRWAALLADQTNIREVMAFPKTQSGNDLMLDAPSPPEDAQFAELGLRFVGVPPRAAPPTE